MALFQKGMSPVERIPLVAAASTYIACGETWWMANQDTAQYMLTMIEGNLAYIRQMTRQHRPGEVTHHHGEKDHLTYLERPFHEAREEILRRTQRLER